MRPMLARLVRERMGVHAHTRRRTCAQTHTPSGRRQGILINTNHFKVQWVRPINSPLCSAPSATHCAVHLSAAHCAVPLNFYPAGQLATMQDGMHQLNSCMIAQTISNPGASS